MAQDADAAVLSHQQGQRQPAAPVFALTSTLLGNGNKSLDWSKPENQKLYNNAIEKLNMSSERKSDHIILLAQATQNQAEKLGFNQTIMNIPDGDNVNRHLIDAHRLLSYQNIEDWANVNIVNQRTRAAQ